MSKIVVYVNECWRGGIDIHSRKEIIMKSNLYNGYKIYGPYIGGDGRYRLILRKDGKNRTLSYPKYLMEIYLGRRLFYWETVHHIDGDFTNNNIDNLEVKERRKHSSDDAIRLSDQEFRCPVCNKRFILKGKQVGCLISNRQRGTAKTGPYCSKKCAGIRSNKTNVVKKIYV